jgi:hypothetical protein
VLALPAVNANVPSAASAATVPGLHETGPDDLGQHGVHGDVVRGESFQGHPAIIACNSY